MEIKAIVLQGKIICFKVIKGYENFEVFEIAEMAEIA